MLYVLHGDDEFTRSEELAKLRSKLGDPTVASLNTTVLSGRDVNLSALVQACDALPFMAERRLVIVQDLLSRFEPKEGRKTSKDRQPKASAADAAFVKGLLEYLPRMPEAARLAFVESRPLSASNPVLIALPSDRKTVYIKEFEPPKGRELERWIEQRMVSKGGKIEPQAAQELARLAGNDLRQLDQELEKLLAYANFQRDITVSDVHSLVHAAQTVNVFALVDSIGLRQGDRATNYLHELLEGGAAPLYLLTMIERQFRILLQVKELHERRASMAEMQKALGIRQDWVIEKSLRQAQHFSLSHLEEIHRHLAEVEFNIKTGEITDVLALDLLVTELCA